MAQDTEKNTIASDWIWLESAAIEPRADVKREGQILTVRMTSPYDIPEAVRSRLLPGNRLVIEFKYLEEEPLKREERSEGVVLFVGRRTGRLYAIDLILDRLKSRDIHLTLENAQRKLAPSERFKRDRRENYNLVRRILDLKSDQLVSSLGF